MLFKYIYDRVRFHSLKKFIHQYHFKMDKAYLRHLSDTNQFQITFHYNNPDLKVNRQFNLCRQNTETVETFLTRVQANVEKVINKKKNKKKKVNENEEPKSVNLSLYSNGDEVLKDRICSEIFQPDNNITLNLLEKSYEIIINSPWVESITLPTSILVNFPSYPNKFETTLTDKNLSDFVWFKSADKKTWSEVGRGFIYTPTSDELNCYLKLHCIPRNSSVEGPIAEVVSVCKVEAGPGECPFDVRHKFTKERTSGDVFRVVTFNILADLYCDQDYTREVLHPYCPVYALSIDYRKQLVLKEILGYNADIICLQEVDRKVFTNDLQPILSHYNLEGELSVKGGQVTEGLAFFYNSKRFEKLECHRIFFAEHIDKDPLCSDIWEKITTNQKLSERILARTTTLQVNIVKSLEFDEILVVGNIHLYFHPDADHIRLLHGAFAIRYLENFVNTMKLKNPNQRCSLIFCGDFNSTPECGIYKLYTTGSVPSDFIDYRSNSDEIIEDVNLKQNFQLQSACGTPKYTNYTQLFADCLDYIFFEKDKMEVVQVVPLPSIEELQQHTALPSVVFPSDHIALISDLKWNR